MEKKKYERDSDKASRGTYVTDKAKKPHGTYPKKNGHNPNDGDRGGDRRTFTRPQKNAYGGKPYQNAREKSAARVYPESDAPLYTDASQTDAVEDVAENDSGLIVGRNAVRELLRSGRPVDKLYVSGREGSITMLVAEAKKRGIPVVDAEIQKLDAMANGEHHQGIIAQAAAREYATIADILQISGDRGEMPLVVVCDGVEDPHNLGAIIRCAECCGAHGVIIPKRRACGLTTAVAKASAGAVEHMAVARVQNIAGAIEELKKAGVWTFAAEAGGGDFWEADFHIPCAIVLGSEGDGVSRLVRERCDFLVSIPMYGAVNSLNVSTAASILLCHAARMQRAPK